MGMLSTHWVARSPVRGGVADLRSIAADEAAPLAIVVAALGVDFVQHRFGALPMSARPAIGCRFNRPGRLPRTPAAAPEAPA